jgi:predicted RNase H-like HicB family nuclease
VRGEGEVVALSKGRSTVVYERDESGAWLARVPDVPGCHTYGRSIRQAQRRIREALGLWVDDADQAELIPDIRLPRQARTVVSRAKAERARALKDQQEAARADDRPADDADERVLLEPLGDRVNLHSTELGRHRSVTARRMRAP